MNTTTVRTRSKTFDGALNTPAHQNWLKHRDVVVQVPVYAAGYRGCFGLAMLLGEQTGWQGYADGSLLVPDSQVTWLTLIDLPQGALTRDAAQEAHWLTVRKTCDEFGAPRLRRGSEAHAFDFRYVPHPDRSGDVLNSNIFPEYFRAGNALEWAMTSTAFRYMSAWREKQAVLRDALGLETATVPLLFGERSFAVQEHSSRWMPTPWLAFPTAYRESLFGFGSKLPGAMDGVLDSFCDAVEDGCAYVAKDDCAIDCVRRETYAGLYVQAVVIRGEHFREVVRFPVEAPSVEPLQAGMVFQRGNVIARQNYPLPERWSKMTPECRRDWFDSARGEAHCRLWFERQFAYLMPGYMHLAFPLCAPTMLAAARPGQIFWDVQPSFDYYNEEVEGMIFPTVRMDGWRDLRGVIGGVLPYDLTPLDSRYVSAV